MIILFSLSVFALLYTRQGKKEREFAFAKVVELYNLIISPESLVFWKRSMDHSKYYLVNTPPNLYVVIDVYDNKSVKNLWIGNDDMSRYVSLQPNEVVTNIRKVSLNKKLKTQIVALINEMKKVD